MAQNEDLQDIIANQAEASAELGGLPGKIEELLAQVEAGETVDPELLAAAKAGAAALAAIVPNVEPPVVDNTLPEPEPVDPDAPHVDNTLPEPEPVGADADTGSVIPDNTLPEPE